MRYTALSQDPKLTLPKELANVRGWEVRTADDDDKIGKVSDLIFGSSRQPAYLDVDVGGFLSPKHVLLPIGLAQLDATEQIVWVPEMTKEQLKALPDYPGDPAVITEEYEAGIRKAYPSTIAGEALFDQQRFRQPETGARGAQGEARLTRSEEELAVGRRPVQAGEVGVKKTVETQHVREPVTKRREEVEIERRPAEGAYARGAEIGEDEIRVPVVEEEIVAEKRPVVKEEIVVKKRTVEETENVEADLRKERVDVEKRGRTKRRNEERGEAR
jgi:uncharacterized protein (TIGR02271 family)